jgi:hypothetical protein
MFPGKANAPWIVESILWMDDGKVKQHAQKRSPKVRVTPHKH